MVLWQIIGELGSTFFVVQVKFEAFEPKLININYIEKALEGFIRLCGKIKN